MARLSIKSTNPKLSFVLAKNPSTGLLVKQCRQGLLYGWFNADNPQVYNIWFRDSDTEVSFKENAETSFEYLDTSRYNSPLFPISAISEILGSASKKRQDGDGLGFEHELTINLVNITNTKYLEIFKQITDFNLGFNLVAPNNYKVVIKTNLSIYELLGYVNLFCLFNALKNEIPIVLDEDFVKKYLTSLNAIDAPYLLRYVFKVNLLRHKETFNKYKSLLETSNHSKIEMTFGSTTKAREDFVKSSIGADKLPILDVGCGEGNYIRLLARQMENVTYYAVDTNSERIEDIKHLVQKKQIENVKTFASIESVISDGIAINDYNEKINVLLIEVLEHMKQEDAELLLKKVLDEVNVNKVIITTPNNDFSKNFGFDEGDVRHDDHEFEFVQQSFIEFLNKIVSTYDGKYSFETRQIGDIVNGTSMGLSSIISRC